MSDMNGKIADLRVAVNVSWKVDQNFNTNLSPSLLNKLLLKCLEYRMSCCCEKATKRTAIVRGLLN